MAAAIESYVRLGDEDMVMRGLDTFSPDRFYITAVKYGRLSILRKLIERAPHLFSFVEARYLLNMAIRLHHTDIAHMILDMPGLIRPNDVNFRTFSAAVRYRYVDIVHKICLIQDVQLPSAGFWAYEALKRDDIDMVMAIVPALSVAIALPGLIYTANVKNNVGFMRRLVASSSTIPRLSWGDIRQTACKMGDVSLFNKATSKLKQNNNRIYSWQSGRDLVLAVQYDRPETIDLLISEIESSGTGVEVMHDNHPQKRFTTALSYCVRHGSIRTFKTLVANPVVSKYFSARDTHISWAAKYGRGEMVDILLSSPAIDNCTRKIFKQSGVYKAYMWAVKAKQHRVLQILSESTSLQTFLKDGSDMLQAARLKGLANERKYVSRYATLNMILPSNIVKHISSFLETDDLMRFNIMSKHGARDERMWKIVDKVTEVMNRNSMCVQRAPRFSNKMVQAAIRNCQQPSRKRPLDDITEGRNKKQKFVIDLTII